MKRSLVLGGLCIWALTLGACGNDLKSSDSGTGNQSNGKAKTVELSGDDAAYAKDLSSALVSGDSSGFPQDQADCWSSRLVSDFGVDRLKEIGLTPESMAADDGPDTLEALSAAEEESFTSGFTECIDLVQVMIASAKEDGGTVTPEMEDCFNNAITDKSEAAFATVLIKGQDAAENDPKIQAVIAPLMGCMFMGMDTDGEMSTSTTS